MWQGQQIHSVSLILKLHGERVKWEKTMSLKSSGEAICVRKLAPKIVIMKNRLRNTSLILILAVMCVCLGPQCAISSCPRKF